MTFASMDISKVCLNVFFFVALIPNTGKASAYDSTVIVALKEFIDSGLGYKTRDQFFTTWSEGGKPAVVVYVNPQNSIGTLGKGNSKVIGVGYDDEQAKKIAMRYDSLGFHTLIYKTYGTGRTELSPRLLSYSPESTSFIVLHEFIHHYIMDRKLNLPPEYHEALGDILGNYGTIEFSRQSSLVSKRSAKAQRMRNEKIYKAINHAILKINNDSTQVAKMNAKCRARIDKILGDDLFQDDRFNYKVNNAYLFRYRSYTEKYFVLKKLLKKQKSIRGLLKVLEEASSNSNGFEHNLKIL